MNVLFFSLHGIVPSLCFDCVGIALQMIQFIWRTCWCWLVVGCWFCVKISSGLCDLAELVDKLNATHANKLNLRHINSLFHRKVFPSVLLYFFVVVLFSCFRVFKVLTICVEIYKILMFIDIYSFLLVNRVSPETKKRLQH